MNIERKDLDEVSLSLTLSVEKADYQSEVEQELKKTCQKVQLPGFRPGKAPKALVEKMYRKSIIADVVNKMIPAKLEEYLKANELRTLCEPILSEGQELLDFEKDEDFKLSFDIALMPNFDLGLNKDVKMTKYDIQVDDELLNSTIKSYQGRYGKYDTADTVIENDIVKCNIVELENGAAKENGIKVENAVLSPKYLKNEEQKALIVGAAKSSKVVFNPKKAMEVDAEIASFLKIKKEEAQNITSDFELEIIEISRFTEAELNQELFDKALGEGVVKSEEEFRNKVSEEMKKSLEADSNYKILIDAQEYANNKLKDIKFPDSIFRRNILLNNKDLTEEKLNETYEKELTQFKWLMAKNEVMRTENVNIGHDDVLNCAKRIASNQFAQYGMISVSDEVLTNYANEMMKNEQQVRHLLDQVRDDKFVEILKDKVTLDPKEISLKDFNAMFNIPAAESEA